MSGESFRIYESIRGGRGVVAFRISPYTICIEITESYRNLIADIPSKRSQYVESTWKEIMKDMLEEHFTLWTEYGNLDLDPLDLQTWKKLHSTVVSVLCITNWNLSSTEFMSNRSKLMNMCIIQCMCVSVHVCVGLCVCVCVDADVGA